MQLSLLAMPITFAIAVLCVFILQLRERISTALIGGFVEILRAGVEAISRGQIEAGSPSACVRRRSSAICSSIAASELTPVGAEIEGQTFRSFEVYFTVAALYLVMSYGLSKLFTLIYRLSFSCPAAQ